MYFLEAGLYFLGGVMTGLILYLLIDVWVNRYDD